MVCRWAELDARLETQVEQQHLIRVKDSPLTWSRLRAIGKSSAARITVLLPLIGYLIIFNKSVADFLHLVSELSGSSEQQLMSVSPKLMLVYLGTCGIAIGQIIYGTFCPPEVKGYGHETPYILGAEKVTKDFGSYSAEYLRMRNRYEHDLGPPITEEQKATINNGVLHLYFRWLNNRWWVARWITAICYFVGLISGAITRGFHTGHENHYPCSTY